jgi:hypothetical protein
MIASDVNELFRARGGTVEFSPEAIGHKLKALGFPLRRASSGMRWSECPETGQRLHELAGFFGIQRPDCQQTQSATEALGNETHAGM